MKWKATYTHVDYSHGASRLKRVFAWLPTNIDGTMVWMEKFEILQVYIIVKHIVVLDPNSPKEGVEFSKGSWVDVSKRLMK